VSAAPRDYGGASQFNEESDYLESLQKTGRAFRISGLYLGQTGGDYDGARPSDGPHANGRIDHRAGCVDRSDSCVDGDYNSVTVNLSYFCAFT
jgi:hypothetical protein